MISVHGVTKSLKSAMAYLGKCDAGVGVLDGRNTPIGVEADVRLLLDIAKVHEIGVIGQT